MKIPIAGCDRDASYFTNWAPGEACACQTIIFLDIKRKKNNNNKIYEILEFAAHTSFIY